MSSYSFAGAVVLLVILVLVVAYLSFRGMFLGFWVDECGVVTVPCEPGLLSAGRGIGMLSPWAIFFVAVSTSIVLMGRRRRASWVPLLALVLTTGSHILATVLVDVALQS